MQASTYKFDQKLDQSLRGSSKFVKISENEDERFDNFRDEHGEQKPLNALVETWNESEFEFSREGEWLILNSFSIGATPFKAQLSNNKNKYSNHGRDDVSEEDDINEEYDNDYEETKNKKDKAQTPEEVFADEGKYLKHQELLDARNMLANAMKDASYLIKKEEDIEKLATNSHFSKQLNKVGDINKEMDDIEKMINEQNESNLKRKPMENSMSTIKSSAKKSVKESNRDPFDKLEDVGRSVDTEELRQTAKSFKSQKRKTWGNGRFRKEEQQEEQDEQEYEPKSQDEDPDLDLGDDDEEQEEHLSEKQTPTRNSRYNQKVSESKQKEVRKSTRYDYDFENTNERHIYDTPDAHNQSKGRPMDEDEYNIANDTLQKSSEVFSYRQKDDKKSYKTQENFHKKKLQNKEDEDYASPFTHQNNTLSQDVWKQNFAALKTNYLKVMNQNVAKSKQFYGTNHSELEQDSLASEKPPMPKNGRKPSISHHAVPDSEFEKFRKTMKDDEKEYPDSPEEDNNDNFMVE